MDTFNPKLYVGTYAKYNNGSIFGKWICLANYEDVSCFFDYCKLLHFDESDPEFMFQDVEGLLDSWYCESYIDPAIWDILSLDKDVQLQVLIYHQATGYSPQQCLDDYENMFYFAEQDAWNTMLELYPQVQQILDLNVDFVDVSEHQFKQQFTRVSMNNETYYVEVH